MRFSSGQGCFAVPVFPNVRLERPCRTLQFVVKLPVQLFRLTIRIATAKDQCLTPIRKLNDETKVSENGRSIICFDWCHHTSSSTGCVDIRLTRVGTLHDSCYSLFAYSQYSLAVSHVLSMHDHRHVSTFLAWVVMSRKRPRSRSRMRGTVSSSDHLIQALVRPGSPICSPVHLVRVDEFLVDSVVTNAIRKVKCCSDLC